MSQGESRGLFSFLREVFIVLIGVLIALLINEWREIRNNKEFVSSVMDVIERDIKNNQESLQEVFDRHVLTIDSMALHMEDQSKSIYEVIEEIGGIQYANIKNVSLDYMISNRAELLDYEVISMVASMEKTPVYLNSTILQTRRNLNEMTATFKGVGEELNATLRASRPLLTNLTQFSDSLKHLELKETIDQTNQALTKLNSAIDHFSKADGTLGKLINEDSLYVNINNTLKSLDQLLIHIDSSPKHFFAPLGKSKSKIEKDRKKASKGK